MNTSLIVDVTGWAGAAALLIAYALVSTGRWQGTTVAYQCLNIAGGVLLVINTIYYRAYPSAFVNIVWIGIALYAIAQTRLRLRPDPQG